jgi:hypothetical protein
MAHAVHVDSTWTRALEDEGRTFDEVRGVIYSVAISLAVVWLPVMWAIIHYAA